MSYLPYKLGTRRSIRSGRLIYVFEFIEQPFNPLENPMNTIEAFLIDLVIKTLHKSAPALSPEDDAKIRKAATDFIVTTMDLTAVFFAIRNAKK